MEQDEKPAPSSSHSNVDEPSVELNVNYCNEGNEGLCYFKEVRLVIPVKVTATGAAAPVVTYSLESSRASGRSQSGRQIVRPRR